MARPPRRAGRDGADTLRTAPPTTAWNDPHARCARCPPGRPRARGAAKARRARPRAWVPADAPRTARRSSSMRPWRVSPSGRPVGT